MKDWGIPVTKELPLKIIPYGNIRQVEVDIVAGKIVVTILLLSGFWMGGNKFVRKLVLDDQDLVEQLLSQTDIAHSKRQLAELYSP